MKITRTIKKTEVSVIYYSKEFRCESTEKVILYGEVNDKQLERECKKAVADEGVYIEHIIESVTEALYEMPIETFIEHSSVK